MNKAILYIDCFHTYQLKYVGKNMEKLCLLQWSSKQPHVNFEWSAKSKNLFHVILVEIVQA